MEKGYYSFKYEDKYFCLSLSLGITIEITEALFNILEKYKKGIELLNEEQQIINNLYESGILEDIKIEIEEEKLKIYKLLALNVIEC